MRFQTPQFIDIEDKIFGPLTLKQFIYLAGGVGGCVVLFYLIPYRFVAFIFMAPIVALSLALAFYKPNNKPFINMLEAFFKYITTTRLYIWKKEQKTPSFENLDLDSINQPLQNTAKNTEHSQPPRGNKLKDLTWGLDVKGDSKSGRNETVKTVAGEEGHSQESKEEPSSL